MKSKRERIMDLVIARLKSILTTAGYQTNVGNNVDYWRTGSFSEEEMADKPEGALGVRDLDEIKSVEGDNRKVARGIGTEKFERDIHVQVEIAKTGEQSPTDVHKIIADIETAIGKDVRWHEGAKALAIGTRPRIDRSLVDQQTLKTSGVVYEFFIRYVTDAFNPYR